MTQETRCAWMSMTTFFIGFAMGVGAGFLLAPQSGARTRRQLHGWAKDVEEETSHILGDAKTSIAKVIDRSKSFVS